MPTYRKRELARTSDGYYCRAIGRGLNKQGRLVPRRFLLGKDERRAQLASLRLEQLWQDIEQAHSTHQLESDQPDDLIARFGEPQWTDTNPV